MPWKIKVAAPGNKPASNDLLDRVSQAEEALLSLENNISNLNERYNEIKDNVSGISAEIKQLNAAIAKKMEEMNGNFSGVGRGLAGLEREIERLKMSMVSTANKEETAELRSYINVMIGEKLAH